MADNTRTKITDVRNDKSGNAMQLTVLITSLTDGETSTNKPYVKIGITDGDVSDAVNLFDTSTEEFKKKGFSENSIVDVRLKMNNKGFLNLASNDSISLTANQAIKLEDFIRQPAFDVEQMYNEIITLIQNSANNFDGKCTPLADLAVMILNNNKNAYITSSAAESVHHNMLGGLIYHSYRMVKAADALCNVYTSLDRELMVCGAALHDIGKIWEYKTSVIGDAAFTRDGVLYGHLYMGGNAVSRWAEGGNYNKEKVDLLVHMILSHHGIQEWGAVSCPATAEACALHYIDCLDVKMFICEENDKMLKPGMITNKKLKALDNSLYKPNFEE